VNIPIHLPGISPASHSSLALICRMLVKAFNLGIAERCVRVMPKKEFCEMFDDQEWGLLCSKSAFLELFFAEPYNAEQVQTVAVTILYLDSR
jgi:hypothetical protein